MEEEPMVEAITILISIREELILNMVIILMKSKETAEDVIVIDITKEIIHQEGIMIRIGNQIVIMVQTQDIKGDHLAIGVPGKMTKSIIGQGDTIVMVILVNNNMTTKNQDLDQTRTNTPRG